MIIRLTRAGIRPEREAEAFAILRTFTSGLARPDGMEALFLGRRTSARQDDLVAITVWRDMASLQAALGSGWHRASFLPELDPMLIDATVEHFESIVEVFEELQSIGVEAIAPD